MVQRERSEARLLWVLWLTYGAFYFCRSNLAAAVPGLEHDAGLSKTEIGWILGSLQLAYGVGQLINGQLAERIRPRVLLAIGMFASAALNILFGFATGLYFLLFVWAANGYAQSLGWPSTMRAAANWFSAAHRGRAIGIGSRTRASPGCACPRGSAPRSARRRPTAGGRDRCTPCSTSRPASRS